MKGWTSHTQLLGIVYLKNYLAENVSWKNVLGNNLIEEHVSKT